MAATAKGLRHRLHLSTFQTGLIMAVVLAVIATLLFMKIPLSAKLRSGDTITVDLTRDYKIRPDVTKVKVAGVPIGVVMSVKGASDGTGAVMTLKVNHGIKKVLGSEPSAQVRPTTILGGNYYVQLTPGGDRDGELTGDIPASRTTVPVELDSTINMFNGDARTAIRKDVGTLDSTFQGQATPALRHFAADSPKALRSSSQLLTAAAGVHPDSDLTKVIVGLESVSHQLDGQQTAFADDLDGVRTVSRTFQRQSHAISTTVRQAPTTLRHATAGLTSLSGALDQARRTSDVAGPSVASLSSLLRTSPADLNTVRPVVHNLRPLMTDLDPTVETLVPASKHLKGVVDDVRSPVITRINGPVLRTLDSPVEGKGSPLGYQEFAYMLATLNLNSMSTDSNGAMINFQPGVGPDTVTKFLPTGLGNTKVPLTRLWQSLLGGLTRSHR